MKRIYILLIIFLLTFFFNSALFCQSTYSWIGSNGTGGNGTWNTSTHWSPSRTTANLGDILQFNAGGSPTVTIAANFVNGCVRITNSTSVTLSATGPRNMSITNVTGDDLLIETGSGLIIGTNINITLASNATANISGTLTINTGRTYNTSNLLAITTVLGRILNSGTITNTSTSNLVFSNGATYQHTQNGGAIPTATWDESSNCLVTGIVATIPTGIGQTFGHLDWDCPGQTTSTTLGAIFTLRGDFALVSTGTGTLQIASGTTSIVGNYDQSGGTIRIGGTSARIVNVGGNFSLYSGTLNMSGGAGLGTINVASNFSHTGGTITETAGGSGTIVFNGTSNQSYTSGGTISNTINFTINNSAGITLLTSVTFPAGLTMTTGNIFLNGFTLTLGTGATTTTRGTLNWTSGFITGSGSFTRWFSTAAITLGNVLGLFPMGNSTDNRNIWIGGTPSTGGTISVQHNNLTGTTALSFTENSQNFDKRTNMSWSLSNANGFVGSALALRIQGTGIPGINTVADLNICLASSAAGGTYSAPGGSIANPQVNRSGLNQTTLANTFYIASTSGSPLPVELSYFSAAIKEGDVILNWRTETEVSNYGFEIQRGVDNSEETEWNVLGFVEGNGNSNSPKDYFFNDRDVPGKKYLYRLKQINTDGSFEYSKSIEVNLSSMFNFELSQNYPNPFNPSTSIRFTIPETGIVKMLVYNILGEQVAELLNEIKDVGVYTINFNASGLESGVYFYRIETNGFAQCRKMTLIK